ncbi:MAG: isoprenylcysteine carboxylmethyltransferase family protein, partial [Thiobacillus sp.]|nr:isoprenylcysteine carboxylmethyltransferase family protein [Thiobacillus sp.]
FWRHRTTVNPYMAASSLCTGGPFRFSRNPIYVGDWFILVGVSLLLATWWPLLFAPLIWAMLRYGVIRHEEAHLEAKFGDDYRRYKTRVRRWL